MALPRFRPATTEEIDSIRERADLGPGCTVLALPNDKGAADLIVLRNCYEADPVFFSDDSSYRRRALLMTLLENMLAFAGVPAFYFNVPANEDMTAYREAVKHWGAEQVSREPEIRFKRDLNVDVTKNQ